MMKSTKYISLSLCINRPCCSRQFAERLTNLFRDDKRARIFVIDDYARPLCERIAWQHVTRWVNVAWLSLMLLSVIRPLLWQLLLQPASGVRNPSWLARVFFKFWPIKSAHFPHVVGEVAHLPDVSLAYRCLALLAGAYLGGLVPAPVPPPPPWKWEYTNLLFTIIDILNVKKIVLLMFKDFWKYTSEMYTRPLFTFLNAPLIAWMPQWSICPRRSFVSQSHAGRKCTSFLLYIQLLFTV